TRFSRDWSSDVCSSDLDSTAPENGGGPNPVRQHREGAYGSTCHYRRTAMAQSAISQHVAALSGIPSQPGPAQSGTRLVPALVGRSNNPGTIVHIECPDWCTVDHVADRALFLEDINHQGAPASLRLPADHPARVPVEVYMSWWPASPGEAA